MIRYLSLFAIFLNIDFQYVPGNKGENLIETYLPECHSKKGGKDQPDKVSSCIVVECPGKKYNTDSGQKQDPEDPGKLFQKIQKGGFVPGIDKVVEQPGQKDEKGNKKPVDHEQKVTDPGLHV
jgi:hypothetical protein